MAQFLYVDSTQQEVLKAASFASRRFEGHRREQPDEPEIDHAYRVANLVRNLLLFDEPEYSVIAMLHDVLEKTSTKPELIEAVFGREAARAVQALTRPQGAEGPEAEASYVTGILAASDAAIAVKIADLIDNLITRVHTGEVERTLPRAERFMEALSGQALRGRMKLAKQMLANTIHQVKA